MSLINLFKYLTCSRCGAPFWLPNPHEPLRETHLLTFFLQLNFIKSPNVVLMCVFVCLIMSVFMYL